MVERPKCALWGLTRSLKGIVRLWWVSGGYDTSPKIEVSEGRPSHIGIDVRKYINPDLERASETQLASALGLCQSVFCIITCTCFHKERMRHGVFSASQKHLAQPTLLERWITVQHA
jgi:hypothetical protein